MQTGIAASSPGEHDRRPAADRVGADQRDDHRVGDHRADHHHFAVREVDELDDPVHHRVAQRDDGVDAAQRQPVDHLLQEDVQTVPPPSRLPRTRAIVEGRAPVRAIPPRRRRGKKRRRPARTPSSVLPSAWLPPGLLLRRLRRRCHCRAAGAIAGAAAAVAEAAVPFMKSSNAVALAGLDDARSARPCRPSA